MQPISGFQGQWLYTCALVIIIMGQYPRSANGDCLWRSETQCKPEEQLVTTDNDNKPILCCKLETCHLAGNQGCKLNEHLLAVDPVNSSANWCCDIPIAPNNLIHFKMYEEPNYQGREFEFQQRTSCLDLDQITKMNWTARSLVALQPVELFSQTGCVGDRLSVPGKLDDLAEDPTGKPLPAFKSIGANLNDGLPRLAYRRGYFGFNGLPGNPSIRRSGKVTGQGDSNHDLHAFAVELDRSLFLRQVLRVDCPEELLAPTVWCPFDGPRDTEQGQESIRNMKNWQNMVLEVVAYHGEAILMVGINYERDMGQNKPVSIDMKLEFKMRHNNQIYILRSKTLNRITREQLY